MAKELPEQLVDFAEVIQALEDFTQAKIEHDKVLEKFEGFSWDYYGHRYIEAMEEAKERAEDLFQKCVQQAVVKAMGTINE